MARLGCSFTDRKICDSEMSSREDSRRLRDSRPEFWERASARAFTADGDENNSRPDSFRDRRLVLVDRPSFRAVVMGALETEAGDAASVNPQDNGELPLILSSLIVLINRPPLMTSELAELLASIIPRISANNSLLMASLWMAQSKNLMLANRRPSRTRILRRLWRILGDHEQFQKVRCVLSSCSISVLRSSKRARRTEDSELAARLLASKDRFPMRYEERVFIVCGVGWKIGTI